MSYMAKIDPFADEQNNGDATLHRNDRLLRLPEVMQRVGLKRSAIYKRMKADKFPKSRKLGPRYTVWVESEVDAWVSKMIAN